MVDGVVKEQHLRRLDKYRYQREKAVLHKDAYSGRQYRQDTAHQRTDRDIAQHRQSHSDDTRGEVVDQHLEAGRHMPFHDLVELLDAKTCQRSHDHGRHQHRDVCVA